MLFQHVLNLKLTKAPHSGCIPSAFNHHIQFSYDNGTDILPLFHDHINKLYIFPYINCIPSLVKISRKLFIVEWSQAENILSQILILTFDFENE